MQDKRLRDISHFIPNSATNSVFMVTRYQVSRWVKCLLNEFASICDGFRCYQLPGFCRRHPDAVRGSTHTHGRPLRRTHWVEPRTLLSLSFGPDLNKNQQLKAFGAGKDLREQIVTAFPLLTEEETETSPGKALHCGLSGWMIRSQSWSRPRPRGLVAPPRGCRGSAKGAAPGSLGLSEDGLRRLSQRRTEQGDRGSAMTEKLG